MIERYRLKTAVTKPVRRHPRRVSDRAAPGRLGTVVLAYWHYPVSIVKWDDGTEQYVLNEFLTEPVDTQK